ncbi:MAG: FAD-dependent oxidoreductase [Oscillospiraceae bacterium]|nr:FAD-dependent oxidoreductase [Oscillospiraceae bacterium]
MENSNKTALIIGAGPAGLGAAYELLKRSTPDKPWDITILEASDKIGGNSRTVEFEGNYVDIGPHHFFTNSEYIKSIWNEFLPEQGAPACDDKLFEREVELNPGGPDPDTDKQVMLKRKRVSRILYEGKFFDYPLSFKKDTILKLGLKKTLYFGFSVLKSRIFRRKEVTMEDYLINKFGRGLYNEFFKAYTYKAWGDEPCNISSECGTQRIQGISLRKALKQLFKSILGIKPAENDEVKGSINEVKVLRYPKHGAGQMWELLAEQLRSKGVKFAFGNAVTHIKIENKSVTGLTVETGEGMKELTADYVISTIPLSKLFGSFTHDGEKPSPARDAALALKYRNFVMIGIFASRLSLQNDTGIKTIDGSLPDCWSYIYNNVAMMSRFGIYNNFSPYVVSDWQREVFLGMEYFCNENDDIWKGKPEESIEFAVKEAVKLGLLERENIVRTIKVQEGFAYPVYSGSYANFGDIRDYIDTLDNLYSIGRKGQHRYLDMDQSFLTAVECVKHIHGEISDKRTIWEVTEEVQ